MDSASNSARLKGKLFSHYAGFLIKRDFFREQKPAHRLAKKLPKVLDPAERARILDELAVSATKQADLFPGAFGPYPADGGQRDMSEAIRNQGRLLRVLASTERAIASGTRRLVGDPELERPAAAVLDRVVAAPTREARSKVLLDELWPIMTGIAGPHAASVITMVAHADDRKAVRKRLAEQRWRDRRATK